MTAAAERRKAISWALIGVLGALMIAAPSVWDIDINSGGGALLFLGFIAVICSVVVASMYFNRARTLARMESKESLLVAWDLPEGNGGKTVISMDGVITSGVLYTFKDVACKLVGVALKPTPAAPGQIELKIDVPSRHGTKVESLVIEIPKGQVDAAKDASRKLEARYLGKSSG